MATTTHPVTQAQPRTNAQRQADYRARQRAKRNADKSPVTPQSPVSTPEPEKKLATMPASALQRNEPIPDTTVTEIVTPVTPDSVTHQSNPIPTISPENRCTTYQPRATLETQPDTGKEQGPAISEEELAQVLADTGKKLTQAVDSVLPAVGARTRAGLAVTLKELAKGSGHLDAIAAGGCSWGAVQAYRRFHPRWAALWDAARETGEQMRKARRADVAHKRAVDGWEEPVFQRGEQVGVIRRFDNRLLQFLLESDDPAKYRPAAASLHVSTGVQTIVTFHEHNPANDLPPAPMPVSAENRENAPPPA